MRTSRAIQGGRLEESGPGPRATTWGDVSEEAAERKEHARPRRVLEATANQPPAENLGAPDAIPVAQRSVNWVGEHWKALLTGLAGVLGALAAVAEISGLTLADIYSRSQDRDVATEQTENTVSAPSANTFVERAHSGAVWAADFNDSGLLATAGSDHSIVLWDTEHGDKLRTLAGHLGRVRSVAFSPDSLQLASSGDGWGCPGLTDTYCEGVSPEWSVHVKQEG